MLKSIKGFVCVALLCILAGIASGQSLTVTSPTNNAYLGLNNTLSFQISGAIYQTTVTATVTDNDTQAQFTSSNSFTPSAGGAISGTLPINFASTDAGGDYTIVVTATSPDVTFNSVTIPVTVVLVGPKFLDFTPITGTFCGSVCHIRATLNDQYLQNWQVQVDGANIPNNSGTTTTVSVDWNTTGAKNGSSHTISITATDLAGNTANETMSVTVVTTPPTITMTYPLSSEPVSPIGTINVIVDISSITSSALDQNSITVQVQTTTGAYWTTVARVSTSALNSTTLRWTGRIQQSYVHLPGKFNIVANAIDLAGNVATQGSVTVTLR